MEVKYETFFSFSTNPFEFLQEYRISPIPDIAKMVIEKLSSLQNVVMAVRLPKTSGNHAVMLKPGQRDITTDPNKVNVIRYILSSNKMRIAL